MLIALRKSELGAALAFDRDHRLNFDLAWFWRIMRIGFPVCLQDLAWVSGNFLLFAIFALCPDPTSLEGAWAIGLRVEDVLAGMPIYAISMGAATIIGQCLGAGKPQRAEKVGWHATLYGASLMLLVGGFMFAFSRPLAFSMSDSASSATAAASYLSIVGLSQPFQLTWVALFGCMEGAGYTRVPMLASFVFLVLVRVPLAYFLTIEAKMGAEGTWLAIALTSALGAIIGILLFRRGTWKLNRV